MKLTKTIADGPKALDRGAATGDPRFDALISNLRGAKTLSEVGDALTALRGELPGAKLRSLKSLFGGIGQAFTEAMAARPGGVRPLLAEVAENAAEMKLFCGEATPEGVREMAKQVGMPVGKKDFSVFSTGDPFTFLGTPPDAKKGIKGEAEDVKNKRVLVVQGGEAYVPSGNGPRYDQAMLVAEALQIAYAARDNGAKEVVVAFPESLNPATNPDNQFADLVARLARASGVDRVSYHPGLDVAVRDGGTAQTVRGGLPTLGPKTQEAEKWLATLGAATDLDGVSRALAQLDVALTGLKGKYETEARGFAARVADVLTAKVNALIPGLPAGTAGVVDGRAVVFAGQSNPALSADIAANMNARLGTTAVSFEGSSPFAMIGDAVKGRPAVIVQTTRQDPYTAPEAKHSAMALLAEALMLCDQATKAGASETTLVMPYMPNARSDKKDQKGVGAYASLVARWVDELKLAKVVLVEPHDIHVPAFFRTPVRVISGAEVLSRAVIGDIGRDDLVLVRPDEGATKRTKQLGKDLELKVVNGEKTRADNTGTTAHVESLGNKSDVAGKVCLVNDDEIATGGTMRQTVALLKENGAKQVHVAISHGNMPTDPDERHGAMRKLKEAGADSLYLLDTQPVGKLPPDLASFVKVVSIAGAIAEEAR